MHPDHRDQHQHEQRHEAAGPQPGQVEQGAEQDRQNEAAQAADHADQTTHRADMLRVVDRDVLVDRRLAQGHEETEHEDDDDETGQPHFEVEREGLLHPVHHVVGRWIGEQKGGDDGDEEGPVEHPPRAVGIGEVATIGAEEAGRNREQRRDHPGTLDVELVDLGQVARQPERQRDKGAEDKEVVEREAPHLHILQRLQFEPGAFGLDAGTATLDQHRVILGRQPEQHGGDGQARRPDLRDALPAERHQRERGEQLGDGGADVAHAEDAERRALLLLRIPARDIGNADREGAAGNADPQPRQQDLRIGLGLRQQPGGHGGGQHRQREDQPAAVEVAPDPQRHPDQRAGQNRHADQQAELGLVQTQLFANADADDRKDGPYGEADGKGHRARAQDAGRLGMGLAVHRSISFCRWGVGKR